MADIFVSHSELDRKVAQTLAIFLKAQGWTVWWDKTLIKHHDPHKLSMAALRSADLVVVIWSKSSVANAFVLEEAIAARDAKKLLQLIHSENQPKQIPLRRAGDPMLDVSDLMQISLAITSFMRGGGRRSVE